MKVNVYKHKGVKLAKDKGVCRGRSVLYSPNAKDPQKRLVHYRVVEMLEQGVAISKIAKEVNITRQTFYRIKNKQLPRCSIVLKDIYTLLAPHYQYSEGLIFID